MDRIKSLNKYQRVLLIIMAVMVVIFTAIYIKAGTFNVLFEEEEYSENYSYDFGGVVSNVNVVNDEAEAYAVANSSDNSGITFGWDKETGFVGWLIGMVACVINVFSILFVDELFYWDFRYRVRNAHNLEPSDWEIKERYITWTALPILALYSFVIGYNID